MPIILTVFRLVSTTLLLTISAGASFELSGRNRRFFNTLQEKESASVHLTDIRSNVPGEPGMDYPTYRILPQTDFTCQGRARGYYADEEAACQVFHVCDGILLSSFLCPIGSIFSQKLLTCDWWSKVDCTSSSRYVQVQSQRDYYKLQDEDEILRKAHRMVNSLLRRGETSDDYLVDPDWNVAHNDEEKQKEEERIRDEENSRRPRPSYIPTVPTVTTTTRKFYSPTVPMINVMRSTTPSVTTPTATTAKSTNDHYYDYDAVLLELPTIVRNNDDWQTLLQLSKSDRLPRPFSLSNSYNSSSTSLSLHQLISFLKPPIIEQLTSILLPSSQNRY
ncbi:uncharacterized protein [Prorops nasuta]|uniref:uncharacterized protein n=1 Tax=Prorops nasuta TaxID=863751 RepID=UPI0034CF596F